MSIAIAPEHVALAESVSSFLRKRGARQAGRALLESRVEELPEFWAEVGALGLLGLHLPEEVGGSGYGLEELAVVVAEFGSALAPGPFTPTVIASAFIATAAEQVSRSALLPGLADGTVRAAVSTAPGVTLDAGLASGAVVVLGGGLAQLLVLASGDDVAIVEAGQGISVASPRNLDPTRRAARITLDSAPATVLTGAAPILRDLVRVILAAEAVGVAAEATRMAAEYAKTRIQFGRPIAMFQAVKHHCANMAVALEMSSGAVWDAARSARTGGDQLSYASAVAATLAGPAADFCANHMTQVHGGIAMTWEHDAHLFMRRAAVLEHFLAPRRAASDLLDLTRAGVVRAKAIELPPEAESFRPDARELAASLAALPAEQQRTRLIETGYLMPHWPRPFGRAANALEQLVIEQEFAAAQVHRPTYGITAWNILTIIQHGSPDQLDRWVRPALDQEVVWCQLFSEPEAGSDAAGIKTRATRVEDGWLINGQKVWTSGAHLSGMGFATVRTNPDVPKHQGITMMAIDMHAPGVEVRPLRMTSGDSEFNEVFFTDVFVPDRDVVGPVDGGWTVARATLGNESVSIGSSSSAAFSMPGSVLLPLYDAHPERLDGGAARLGRYLADQHAVELLNLRAALRAVSGAGPGPEGAISKLMVSEIGHESSAITTELLGEDALFMDGVAAMSNMLLLLHRGLSIAGGTSEIKRNQIGERILGLPRDPLIT
ncbi:acyl-CoA dehydrogenase [Nocardia jejuensis]|uniref:acyl-CoA dehydrogenase n=1 Tax=Nocardia jejuensis TaxID=328049 RepID=UPI00082D18D0|nr:acyl-CoA dehydrogenase [Nocardia jejuensis]